MVELAKDPFLSNDNLVACSIANVLEKSKHLPLLHIHIQMISMKLYLKRMVRLSGNVGVSDTNLSINAEKSNVVLTAASLLVILLITLKLLLVM